MTRIAASFVLAVLLATSAVTQPLAQDRPLQERREQPVRIQVATNFFMAGPTNETTGEPEAARQRARRIVYEMASKECAVLQSVLARTAGSKT